MSGSDNHRGSGRDVRRSGGLTSAEQLRGILDFDPQTGEFVWCHRSRDEFKTPHEFGLFCKKYFGKKAGRPDGLGYVAIGLCGRQYRAHRLAWLHFYGSWPTGCIDHLNGNRSDNRINNLRDVDVATNMQNIISARSHSSTGILGVSARGSRYVAQISVNRKKRHLGTFKTPEEAFAAYVSAKRQYHLGGLL